MSDYRFIDKDPVVDIVRTAIHDSGEMYKSIACRAHVSPKTISNWIYGDVKRPQNFTLYKVFRALGVKTEYVYEATGLSVIARPELARRYKKQPKHRKAA